jgi:hypothetical protein
MGGDRRPVIWRRYQFFGRDYQDDGAGKNYLARRSARRCLTMVSPFQGASVHVQTYRVRTCCRRSALRSGRAHHRRSGRRRASVLRRQPEQLFLMNTKRIALALALGLAASPALAQGVHVDPYFHRDGTYVPEHYRSYPDSSYNNNWSVSPNINPHNYEMGTRSPTFPDYQPYRHR